VQRYRCTTCGTVFQSKRRTKQKLDTLWNEYVFGKQTLKQLAEKHRRSIEWVRQQFEKVELEKKNVLPHTTVFIPDTTFFGRTWGVCVFRAPHLKKNIWWTAVDKEVMATYYYGRKILEDRGWIFTAVVVDGRRGMTTVFKDIPVQICQFHQMKNVTKYLTRKPETEAGQELRHIMLKLPSSNEKEFTELLSAWKKTWNEYITDKTYVTGTKHWYYTHKKVRSAYMSLERNLPYLFTYQKYPELKIPNTTNSLDGSFVHLKDKVKIHHGLRKDRRYKVIEEILGGE
jgi:hypothetical protein